MFVVQHRAEGDSDSKPKAKGGSDSSDCHVSFAEVHRHVAVAHRYDDWKAKPRNRASCNEDNFGLARKRQAVAEGYAGNRGSGEAEIDIKRNQPFHSFRKMMKRLIFYFREFFQKPCFFTKSQRVLERASLSLRVYRQSVNTCARFSFLFILTNSLFSSRASLAE